MAVQAPTRLALKRILFATDFSPVSQAALPFAVAIARRFESCIEAVHVFAFNELQMLPEAAPLAVGGPLTQRAEQQMAALLCSDAFEGVPHDGRVRGGLEVWTEIASVIESDNIDLVVLGT